MHRSPTGNLVPLDLEIEATLRRNRVERRRKLLQDRTVASILEEETHFFIHYHLIHHHQGNPLLNCLKLLAWQTSSTRGSPLRIIQAAQYRLPNEDPYAYLATFIEICNTVKIASVPYEAIRLSLFSFSLAGEAKRWLHSFKGNSLKTWDEVVEKFLKKYFPESKTAERKAVISSFHQFPDESLSEALERFRGLLRKTPTHGFSEPIQLNMFIDGLRPQTKQLLDASAGGKIKLKTPKEAIELIENIQNPSRATGVVSDSLTFERLSPVINLAYIRKNCWNPEDLTVSIRGARRARARPAELPSTSAAPTPASTSATPSVSAQTDSQCFEAMLQSIHQGQIILLQSIQVVAPPGSIPLVEQFREMVTWPGTQPSLHREDEGPTAQVPQHVEDESFEATIPEPFVIGEEVEKTQVRQVDYFIESDPTLDTQHDVSFIGACRPRIFFINGLFCFLEYEWQRNGEKKRERRRHFKDKMILEEVHHHRRPWIRAWRKKEMNEGKGREEHEILCSK
ncbi:hypothetical protein GmHk_05G013064 [Glycine max]|nr:hypothetical protein GmHk_05G013064 [Glycine max]